jgi:hypothetical protein
MCSIEVAMLKYAAPVRVQVMEENNSGTPPSDSLPPPPVMGIASVLGLDRS